VIGELHRRRFLEETLIATAAGLVGGPTFGGQAFGGPTGAAQQRMSRVAANDQLRHAVIGCRIRGRAHAAEFARLPDVLVTHVCDPDLSLAQAVAQQVEEQTGRRPQVEQDLRRLMDDPAIDTVSICSPNHWHALSAIWAMQAGKDVYVEKPVSHTVHEGRRMVEVVEQTGRICQVGTQNRSNMAIAAAGDFVRGGGLGKVNLARTIVYGQRSSIGQPGHYQPPPEVDFNLWLGPANETTLTRPQLHYDWHWVWDTGNGELGNNNIHFVDLVRWVLGLQGYGDWVLSIGGRLGYQDAGETPNTQLVVHGFGEVPVIQEVRGLPSAPFPPDVSSGWIVSGSEGFLAGTSLFDPQGQWIRNFEGPVENHFANFVAAVRERSSARLNTDIREGHFSSALCHLGNCSHRVGQLAGVEEIGRRLRDWELDPEVEASFLRMTDHLRERAIDLSATPLTLGAKLSWDADSDRFVDHWRANQLLTRRYREPFVLPE